MLAVMVISKTLEIFCARTFLFGAVKKLTDAKSFTRTRLWKILRRACPNRVASRANCENFLK